jgi:hypothetical protein
VEVKAAGGGEGQPGTVGGGAAEEQRAEQSARGGRRGKGVRGTFLEFAKTSGISL